MTAILKNIAERKFFAEILQSFRKPPLIPTIEWAKRYRIISSKETSFGIGKFNPDITPYMEYLYECLDNPYIPTIVSRKSARIAWTETINNYRGKRIHTNPTSMLLGFPTGGAVKSFAKDKMVPFIENTPILKELVNAGIAENRKSIFDYFFKGGSLKLVTLGAISSQKSNNYEYVEVEEPDDAKDDVAGQGDTFINLAERQKLVPLTRKKFIFGGTPTFTDFSRVDKAVEYSNKLVFKAQCHECHELVRMDGLSFDYLKYDEYLNNSIDPRFGKHDPKTARFECPHCSATWTFEQKNQNIIEGKKFGFIDHTGNFSKGWHPENPEITDVFGFIFSEMLSPFPASNFVNLVSAKLEAEVEKAKGNELPMKSFTNNKKGMSFASGISAIDYKELVSYRKNYPEHIVPMEGLVLTAGVDVQDNRFAIIIRAWGRDNRSWLVTWKEIFGTVTNEDDEIWQTLTEETWLKDFKHASGKTMKLSALSIDSSDNTELVYRWVLKMCEKGFDTTFATKGVRDLRSSDNDIYREPAKLEINSDQQVRKTLAETMGIPIFLVGAHRAHREILSRIALNSNPDAYKNVYFHNEQSYGQYEEQILSCRNIIENKSGYNQEVFKLIPGRRKEAMDGEKLALHASYALQIRLYTNSHWAELEEYYYS